MLSINFLFLSYPIYFSSQLWKPPSLSHIYQRYSWIPLHQNHPGSVKKVSHHIWFERFLVFHQSPAFITTLTNTPTLILPHVLTLFPRRTTPTMFPWPSLTRRTLNLFPFPPRYTQRIITHSSEDHFLLDTPTLLVWLNSNVISLKYNSIKQRII